MSILAKAVLSAVAQRGYDGARTGRLYSDWIAGATSSDTEIRSNLRRLVDRSRDLERNNDYQRGFLISLERNVNGAIRRDLRMDCGDYVPNPKKGKAPVWEIDWLANTKIESAWNQWAKKGVCTVCKRYSWRDVKNLAIRATARDGNFLVRKIFGPAARNKFGFALQIWEFDHLELTRFDTLRNGNVVKFGVETDNQDQVVAYYLRTRHPGDGYGISGGGDVVRVPASEILHLFIRERAEQTVGLPWCVSAITRLRQLGAFEEAAVIAARIGAGKMGFFTKGLGSNGQTGSWTGETNSQGNAVIEGNPGTYEELPEGWDLKMADPAYPNIETGDFRKCLLRGIATSLGMSYTTIGNDLESVSFSSSRVGLFEEREGWKAVQMFMDESFKEPVFGDFLSMAIMSGEVDLPLGKFDKFNRPVFKARRWALLDPLKEIQALKTAIALRVGTRRGFIEEQGGDIEDTYADAKADELLADDMELSLVPPDPEPAAFQNILPEDDDGNQILPTGQKVGETKKK